MGRKKKGSSAAKRKSNRTGARTSISIAEKLMEFAEDQAAEDFNGNFSAYVSDLIRRHKEKVEAAKAGSDKGPQPRANPDGPEPNLDSDQVKKIKTQ